MSTNTKPQLRRGLVGHWKYTGSVSASGTWKDLSGNGNDGTLYYDAYLDKNGVNLDGASDHVRCGNDSSLNPSTKLSGFAYINGTSFASQSVIFSKWTTPGQYSYLLDCASGNLRIIISADGTTTAGVQVDNPLSSAQIYHVGFTYDGASQNVDLYVNGIEVASSVVFGTVPTSLKASTDVFKIGMTSGGYFNGIVDDVMIFDRELSAEEAAFIYNHTKGLHN